MRKLWVGGSVIVCSLLLIVLFGCGILFPDTQIGIDSVSKAPIRQKKILSAGDPMGYVGNKPFLYTKVDMYIRYIDKNNNGRYDENIDEIVYRVPRSDPAIYYEAPPMKEGDSAK
jgi:hypothetical protein